MALYGGCHSGATAKLLKLHGAGHQWPGCKHGIPGLGKVSAIDGNKMIRAFFRFKDPFIQCPTRVPHLV